MLFHEFGHIEDYCFQYKKFGITKIDFPENKLIVGLCKVIDTEPDNKLPNDTIIEIVRNGYIHGKELIREAEVIIVKN